MKKLVDAFIELPTWQGVALISGAVLFVTAIALVVNRIAWQRGWDACHLYWSIKEHVRGVSRVSERV